MDVVDVIRRRVQPTPLIAWLMMSTRDDYKLSINNATVSPLLPDSRLHHGDRETGRQAPDFSAHGSPPKVSNLTLLICEIGLFSAIGLNENS